MTPAVYVPSEALIVNDPPPLSPPLLPPLLEAETLAVLLCAVAPVLSIAMT